MSDTKQPVISDHPPPEMHQDGLEIECQCARCGSSCGYEHCGQCGGEGTYTRFDEDPLWYGEDEYFPCDNCDGVGGFNFCLSSAEWCDANPLPGREDVPRGKIEWFTIPERQP